MFAENKLLTNALSVGEPDVIEQVERFRTVAKDGTCSWITRRNWFTSWLQKEDGEPHILWISGPPGAGKSVLASYIVDIIRKQWGDDFCQYHAFIFSDKSKRSASYLFRSLAYQAARGLSPFRAKVLRMSDQFGVPFSNMSATALWEKLFRGALFNLNLSKSLYWVIDGLDESEPDAIPLIFQCFKSLDTQLRLKILLVSRPTTGITMRVRRLALKCTTHQLSALDTYDDIKVYLEDVVGSMIPKEVATGQRVVEKILSKASGNFLWVSLATKDLEKSWHRLSNIEQILSGFPGEMTPWYSRMMQKIEENPDEETRRMALIFLTWATYAFRPLHIAELKVALQAEFPDLTSLEDTIHSICGDFVHLRGSRVNLIHDTARYFLVNNHPGTVVSTKAAYRHEYLSILCLRHLSSTREKQWRQLLNSVEIHQSKGTARGDPSSLIDDIDPFLSYSATYWPYHLSLSQPDSQPLRDALFDFFKNDALTWVNALGLLGDLRSLIRAAQYLKSFIKSREKLLSKNAIYNFKKDDIEFLRLWAIDLIKIVGKFGSYLVQQPSSIYKLIPPFCPSNSILRKTFGHGYGTFLVSGIVSTDWDDCHARLSVGTDNTATKVVATSEVFAALVPQAHSLVVWHAETCEELRSLHHGEYVTEVTVNKKGDLVCTSGFRTIKIWELGTGRNVGCFDKHTDDRVLAVAFGANNDEILVGYQDCLIVCQNWKTKEMIYAFRAVKGDHIVQCGLRVVSFSPDGTQLAVGSRNRPVDLWDLGTQSWTKRCLMSEEITHSEGDVFQAPEVIQWHPILPNIYILYHNTTLIDWNPVFDEQTEHQLGAKGLVCSPSGNYMLTSDHDGSIRVFALPKYSPLEEADFRPIYQLEHHDHVLDLAFSPNEQRFYDLRGSVCSVWEPEVLVPAQKLDEDDRSSSSGSLWTIEATSSLATPHNLTPITAISCAPNDKGFCCGRDDGTIAIHDMATGKKPRSLPGHVIDMAIIALTWSSSGNWVASGDDSGHVLVRKIQMPTTTNPKLTVYKPSDFRIDEDGITQLLFSSNDKYLLVSTISASWIWDVSAKKLCHRKHTSPRHIKWIEHPKDQSRLVSIDAGEVRIFHWDGFVGLTLDDGLHFVQTNPDPVSGKRKTSSPIPSSLARLDLGYSTEQEEIVDYVTQTNDKSSIIFEAIPSGGHDRDRLKSRRIELFRAIDVDPNVSQRQILLKSNIRDIAGEVSKLMGTYQNQVVFFNHKHWLCTWEIGTPAKAYKRHFFLPKDWINSETLSLSVLSDQGTLLCPRNGEVAIIKNGIRL